MGIYEFKTLSLEKQAELTSDEGVFLMHREESAVKYILYQIDGIYVEFHYDATENKLLNLKSFINPDLLDPYYEQ